MRSSRVLRLSRKTRTTARAFRLPRVPRKSLLTASGSTTESKSFSWCQHEFQPCAQVGRRNSASPISSTFALKYMRELDELTSLCEESLSTMLGLALHFLKILKFNREDSQQLFSVCIYARLLELACACKALLEKNALIGIPVLLRSMFEASVDLSNLIKHPEYSKTMYASFLKEKIRITKEAIKDDSNPFLESIKANQNLDEVLKDTQLVLKQLASEGHTLKALGIAQKKLEKLMNTCQFTILFAWIRTTILDP